MGFGFGLGGYSVLRLGRSLAHTQPKAPSSHALPPPMHHQARTPTPVLMACPQLPSGRLQDVLMTCRGRYNDLLTASAALRVGRALAEDSMAELLVVGQAQASC